jgi:hypothetical protein
LVVAALSQFSEVQSTVRRQYLHSTNEARGDLVTKLKYDERIANSFIFQPYLSLIIMTFALVNSWGMRSSWD